MSDSRRLRKFGFSEEWLVACFQSMNNWPDLIQLPKWDPAIPADAKVESVRYEPDQRCWIAVLSHPSFDEIPNDGQELPFSPRQQWSFEMILIARQPDGSFREDRGQPVELPTQKIITDARKTYTSLTVNGLKELGRLVSSELRLRDASQILFDVGCAFCGAGGENCPVRCLPGIPVSIAYCDECVDKARILTQEIKREHWETFNKKSGHN